MSANFSGPAVVDLDHPDGESLAAYSTSSSGQGGESPRRDNKTRRRARHRHCVFNDRMLRISMLIVVALVAAARAAVVTPATPVVGRVTGNVFFHTVVAGDTLQRLSARFGVDAGTIAADNGLKPTAVLTAGSAVRIDNRHIVPATVEPGVVVINVPQRMLFFEANDAVAAMPVAVGQRDWKTPLGPFTVVTKETDPTWEVPPSIQEEARRAGRYLPPVVPAGRENPLGRFWIGLNIPSLGIHGTNAPASVYRAATHGCIRVGSEDIQWLFSRVNIGTPGAIVYEPILLAAGDHGVFLEVHRDVYGRFVGEPMPRVREMAVAAGIEDQIDWAIATRVISERQGVARNVAKPRP